MNHTKMHWLIPADLPTRGLRHYGIWALLFLGLAWLATAWDFSVAGFNRVGDVPGDVKRILQLSEFFAHGFGVLVVSFGIWFLAREKRSLLPRIVACAVWPGVIVNGLKLVVGRARPGPLDGEFPESIWSTFQGIAGWGGAWNTTYELQSFPSAHTATAFGLAIGLSWAFPRGRAFFWTLAAFGAAQRIAANSHWLSDVLAGGAVAFLFAGALTQNWGAGNWFAKWEQRGLDRLLANGTATLDPVGTGKAANPGRRQAA